MKCRKHFRSVRLGWFPFDFPCGSSIGLGTLRARAPSPKVINGRKMAALRSVNPKAFQVEHGCLSSSEEWGKASHNLVLNTSFPLRPYARLSKCLKTKEDRTKNGLVGLEIYQEDQKKILRTETCTGKQARKVSRIERARVETCAPRGDISEPHLLNIWHKDLNTSSGLLWKS